MTSGVVHRPSHVTSKVAKRKSFVLLEETFHVSIYLAPTFSAELNHGLGIVFGR